MARARKIPRELEAAFTEAWADPTLTAVDIGRRFDASRWTVFNTVRRLGLPPRMPTLERLGLPPFGRRSAA